MTATTGPQLGQITALLAERGYEVSEAAPNTLKIREVDSGVTVRAVLQGKPNLPVELVAVPGDAAKVLIEQSKSADLVVVGARGRGGIGDWLIGSVGHKVVHHAHCSVAIIRGRPTAN